MPAPAVTPAFLAWNTQAEHLCRITRQNTSFCNATCGTLPSTAEDAPPICTTLLGPRRSETPRARIDARETTCTGRKIFDSNAHLSGANRDTQTTKWTYFYLYVVLDSFSRYAVGWMVADRGNSALVGRLIEETCHKQGVQPQILTLHSDRGSPMTNQCAAQLLADLGVTRSLSRPRCPTTTRSPRRSSRP